MESCRRDLLDHIIALHERHLKRLLDQYVRYRHEDRRHLGFANTSRQNCLYALRSDGYDRAA